MSTSTNVTPAYAPLVRSLYNGTLSLYTTWIQNNATELVNISNNVSTAYDVSFPGTVPSMEDWETHATTLVANSIAANTTVINDTTNFGNINVTYTTQITKFTTLYGTGSNTTIKIFAPYVTFFTSLKTYLDAATDPSGVEFADLSNIAPESWSFITQSGLACAQALTYVYAQTNSLELSCIARWNSTATSDYDNNDLDGLLQTLMTDLEIARNAIGSDLILAVDQLQRNIRSGEYLTYNSDITNVATQVGNVYAALATVDTDIQATLGAFKV